LAVAVLGAGIVIDGGFLGGQLGAAIEAVLSKVSYLTYLGG
jgi:hypothetical protein